MTEKVPKKVCERYVVASKMDQFNSFDDIREYIPFMCRGCKSEKMLSSIFDKITFENEEIDLAKVFYDITSIKVKRDDELPHSLCDMCIRRLCVSLKFRKECLEVQRYYRIHLGYEKETESTEVEKNNDNTNLAEDDIGPNGTEEYLDDDDSQPEQNTPNDKNIDETVTDIDDANNISTLDADVRNVKVSDAETHKDITDVDVNSDEFLKVPKNTKAAEYKKKRNERYHKLMALEAASDEIEKHVDLLIKREEERQKEDDDPNIVKTPIVIKNPLFCDFCTIFLPTEDDLKDHVQRIKHPKKYRTKIGVVCKVCDIYIPPKEVKQHLAKHQHPYRRGLCICHICGNKVNKDYYKTHMLRHTNPEALLQYKCELCDKLFTTKLILKDHINTHTGSKPYTCKVCGMKFSTHRAFYQHRNTHHTKETKMEQQQKKLNTHECDLCKSVFKQKDFLIKHRKNIHGIEDYQCTLCNKYCVDTQDLESHMQRHDNNIDNAYQCEICFKSFYHGQHYKMHMRVHENEGKRYECEICGIIFRDKMKLKTHLTNHKEKLHCPKCPKAFFHKSYLTTHMRTHTNERPFECKECGKAFKQPAALYYHKRVHTGEKNYKCDECDKCYRLKGSLVVHKRSHTGEKPYECSECLKRFTNASALKKHYKNHYEFANNDDTNNFSANEIEMLEDEYSNDLKTDFDFDVGQEEVLLSEYDLSD